MSDLMEKCAEELAKNVTTTNVVDRLQLCDEFELLKLRDKIMQQLTCNKKALHDVAQSQQIVQYPHLMQEMLGLMAQEGSKEDDKKKQRKKEMAKAKEVLGLTAQAKTPEKTKRLKQEMLSLTEDEEAQEAAQAKRGRKCWVSQHRI